MTNCEYCNLNLNNQGEWFTVHDDYFKFCDIQCAEDYKEECNFAYAIKKDNSLDYTRRLMMSKGLFNRAEQAIIDTLIQCGSVDVMRLRRIVTMGRKIKLDLYLEALKNLTDNNIVEFDDKENISLN